MEPLDIHSSFNKRESSTDVSESETSDESRFEEFTARLSPLKLLLAVSVPIVGIACGGTREPWALGAATILAGLCLLLAPSKQRPPFLIIGAFILSLLWCALAFLPASFFPLPEWRALMVDGLSFKFPSTYTPQPWVTLEIWLFCAIGILWLNWCLGQGFHERQRRFILQSLALFVSLIALLTIILSYYGVAVSFWRGPWGLAYFGPFPNRNNFSAPLCIGAVLLFAATYDANRRGRYSKILFGLAILPIFAAILLNTSRMGVVLFFGGICLWTLLGGFHKQSVQRFAISASVLLGLAAMFMLFGNHILERFTSSGGVISTIAKDSRLLILSDSIKLVNEAPVMGVGLGNFESLFVLSKSPQHVKSRSLHPESDWTWILTEGGIPAFLLACIGTWMLVRSFGLWRQRSASYRSDRRLRNAAGIGVILLIFQGVVDTPLHTFGIFALGAMLASIAMNARKVLKPAGIFTQTFQRICGLFCILCGTIWILTSMDKYSMPGIFAGERQAELAKNAEKQGDYVSALTHLDQALEMQPLEWSYYYLRAVYKLRAGYSQTEALNDFARSRYLERQDVSMCMKEANTWLSYYPPFATPAWREALLRDPSRAVELYGTMLHSLQKHPELRQSLRTFATTPKLRLTYLEFVTGEEFKGELATFLSLQPTLQELTNRERLRLFQLWYERGDRQKVVEQLLSKTDWRESGWSVLAQHYAAKGDFKDAYKLALDEIAVPFATTSVGKGDLETLQRAFLHNPTDIARGLDLYEAQKGKSETDQALSTLNQLSQLPGAPAKIIYEQGLMFARKDDYAKAWNSMMQYQSKMAE